MTFQVVGACSEATPSNLLDDRLSEAIAKHKGDVIALLRERSPECATNAVLFAQALLRQGRFAPAPPPCAYHCGTPNEQCLRCGASFAEHNAV